MKTFISFVKKDFLIAYSYKLNFLISIFSLFFTLFILSNISKIGLNSSFLGEYKTNPFGYFIIGFSLIDLAMTISAKGISEIRGAQVSGVFEELVSNNKSKVPLLIYFLAILLFLL